ncbi:uncharacterized protein LOC142556862 [Primulina tabacum]|uniref:uncharacterized protein LOC142556862 n=1 Tax=Primulina tabacum TaxID=48773 RepID=UPI003F5A0AE5
MERTARRLRKPRREEIKAMAKKRDNQNELRREVPIREHFRSVINAHYSGIARGTIAANNFELKPALINMVQQNQFGGAATADPHLHLRTFLEITDPVKINSVSDEIIRLRLFPFSLRDQARSWLQSLSLGNWVQIELFYNGLDGQTRGNVDAAVGGTIFSKTPDEAYELLEHMTINSYQWPSERSGSRKPAGVLGQSTSDVALVTAEQEPVVEEAQYINNNRGYGGYRGNPPPNTYHPGLRNHENFSYANNKNVLNPPLEFNTQKGEGKPSFEDLVGTFVAESGKKMARTESRLDSMETHMGNMEPVEENVEILVEKDDEKGVSVENDKVEEPKKVLKNQPLPKVNLSYPQRFKKKGLDDQFAKFLEIFKKIHINIPFADALEQIPNYAKFIKDVMSKKRKLQEFETVKLTEECSAILQRKLPQKLKDPGSFTIPCVIGGSRVNRSLCDLGASINLMPFSIYKTLELGEVKPSTITLQLADISLTYPRGIVEDVLVKVDKFIFPTDFVILDMEEDQETPLIFGRPFLEKP